MAQKIYVGNLSYSTTEETLQGLFAEYGEVTSTVIIKDKFTNQSKGFGFVEMSDDSAADAAIGALNNKDVDGRRLRINIAEDRPRRPPRSNSGGDRYGSYR